VVVKLGFQRVERRLREHNITVRIRLLPRGYSFISQLFAVMSDVFIHKNQIAPHVFFTMTPLWITTSSAPTFKRRH